MQHMLQGKSDKGSKRERKRRRISSQWRYRLELEDFSRVNQTAQAEGR